jgi:hypothetical protein
LVLERIHKLTAPDHPDLETIPIVLTILQDFIKRSEPGIEAAEGKVKYSALHETLIFSNEEIIVSPTHMMALGSHFLPGPRHR